MGRDVQTQFLQKQDALHPMAYEDTGAGSQLVEKAVQTDKLTVVQRIPGQYRRPMLSFLKRKEKEVATQLQRNLKSKIEKGILVVSTVYTPAGRPSPILN
ncbi:hypothetical protein RvY_09556 [Ramazzottius varieornatus]|uniref:Uncharacterized protein n=1 Tax=Ramazzottius varieornatus TaxID=947166 RepID=A0A1D1V9U5_RAMVA|nr:hypothetical protein RvY_09556 [Ramazzottius varieornatus]